MNRSDEEQAVLKQLISKHVILWSLATISTCNSDNIKIS